MRIRQYVSRLEISDQLRSGLARCWVDVTNDGGAVALAPSANVAEEAEAAFDELVRGLDLERCRLIAATDDRGVLGWCVLWRDTSPLVAHVGWLFRLQTRTECRGEGIGYALANQACEIARAELGLRQMHLTVRAGLGLEAFYARLGFTEVGRWPGGLHVAEGDHRDEVLMHRPLAD